MTVLPSPNELVGRWRGLAKKSLGQCFLQDVHILDRIVALAGVTTASHVVEIGPGPGGLTTRLLETGASVDAWEKDTRMVEHLRAAFSDQPRLVVHNADVLKVDATDLVVTPSRVVVANLPYNVATEILARLVDGVPAPERMALMFQREVAERIVAEPGTRQCGALTLLARVRYESRIALRLPPGAFVPAPRVHSAVVLFNRRDVPLCDAATEERLRIIARAAFQQRRKTLRNSLRGITGDDAAFFERAGVDPRKRPEALSIDDFVRLAGTTPR